MRISPAGNNRFDGARASISTHVSLSGDAVYLGWDIICLGRPACQENFDTGKSANGSKYSGTESRSGLNSFAFMVLIRR